MLEAYGVKTDKKKTQTRTTQTKEAHAKAARTKQKQRKMTKAKANQKKVNHDIDKIGSADKGNTDKGSADKAETATPSSSISLLRKIGLVLTFLVMAFCFYKTVSQEDLTRLISDGAVTTEGVRYICLYGIFIAAIAAFIGLLRPIGKAEDREIELQKKKTDIAEKNIIITTGCYPCSFADDMDREKQFFPTENTISFHCLF